MSDTLLSGIAGGLIGGMITAFIALYIGSRARQQNYYGGLANLLAEHNWNRLKENIPSGLPVTQVDEKVSILCYQHIGLFLYAWMHMGIIKNDKSILGWKRWGESIVKGTQLPGNEQYGYAYRDILVHGDLYPEEFINWLSKEMNFSASQFQGPSLIENRQGRSHKAA